MKLAKLSVVFVILIACGGDGGATTTAAVAESTITTTEMMMEEDVLAVAEAEGDLGTFLAATEAAGIMEDLHGEGPFTLFVPTDDAFASYLESANMTQEDAFAGGEMLQSLVGYHIVNMMEDSEMVMGMDGQTFTTLQGAPLQVTVDGETVMVGDATIVRYDIQASNGVIHVIDTVLTPPEA